PTLTALTTVSVNEEAAATQLSTLGGGSQEGRVAKAGQDDSITVQLTVSHGTLTLASTAGLTGASGIGTTGPTCIGLQSSVDTALAAVSYKPNLDTEGTDTLTFAATTTDIAAGSTSTASSTTTMSINVDPVAETPTLTALTTVSVNEDAAATQLSTLGGGTLSVSLPLADQDDSITVQLSLSHRTRPL